MKNAKAFISLLLVFAMVGAFLLPQGVAGAEEAFVPGTYTGEEQGFGGAVVVEITTDASGITAVTVTGDSETPTIGGAALETLAAQILEAQSAEIDGVSGATVTSDAARTAAEAAIAAA